MGKKTINEDFEKVEEILKSKRDNLSKGSLKTYARMLLAFNKKMYNDSEILPERYVKDKETIIKDLSTKKPNSVRTLLSAIIIMTDDIEFRKLMSEKIREQKDFIDTNQMTDKQKENWLTPEEIQQKLQDYKKMADTLYKRLSFPKIVVQSIQDYIILCLVSGEYIAPRRSQDFTDLKIRLTKKQMEANDCNYMHKGKFYFNVYKTSKTYGQQIIEIPKKLQAIIKKWMGLNNSDYLLTNSNNDKMTPTTLGQRLTDIFGKRVGTTSFRRAYLTNKFGDDILKMKEVEKNIDQEMSEMGSSKEQINHYVKDTTDLKKN